MGSPLAPVLANLFMGHHEKDWLQKYKGPEVRFYRRYVDDTFCLFNNDNDASQFFDFINSQHTNIKFTMEKEENHKLPFLDVHELHQCFGRKLTRGCSLVFSVLHPFLTKLASFVH